MAQAPIMPVFTDALLGDTLHLSTEEFGAYCLLLLATWRNNGRALADNDTTLRRICRASSARWRNLRPVLIPFFSTGDGYWHQKRLEKEWEKVQEKITKNRESGAEGGRSTALKRRKAGPASANGSLRRTAKRTPQQPKRSSQNSFFPESLETHTPPAYANGADESEKNNTNGSRGSLRSPTPSAPLREVKKAALVQKLMRFAHATMSDGKRSAAIAGLTGLDDQHSAQWWLDHLDQKMRAAQWDDAREQ